MTETCASERAATERGGQPWLTAECRRLVERVRVGKNALELTAEFGRTDGAIRSRSRMLLPPQQRDIGNSGRTAVTLLAGTDRTSLRPPRAAPVEGATSICWDNSPAVKAETVAREKIAGPNTLRRIVESADRCGPPGTAGSPTPECDDLLVLRVACCAIDFDDKPRSVRNDGARGRSADLSVGRESRGYISHGKSRYQGDLDTHQRGPERVPRIGRGRRQVELRHQVEYQMGPGRREEQL